MEQIPKLTVSTDELLGTAPREQYLPAVVVGLKDPLSVYPSAVVGRVTIRLLLLASLKD